MAVHDLISSNSDWSDRMIQRDPKFFERFSQTQSPEYLLISHYRILWIGCSDSRVPPEVICQTNPGIMFVHRSIHFIHNSTDIANVIALSDLNVCSVIQYAVDYLKVKHIIICGHYGCGGVKASLSGSSFGLLDEWISVIKHNTLDILKSVKTDSFDIKFKNAVEANVFSSIRNLTDMPLIKEAWDRNQFLEIHGWVYDINDGKLIDLECNVGCEQDLRVLG